MNLIRKFIPALLATLVLLPPADARSAAKKKVYMTYILHGNMNYDRYVRPTIWKEFPVIYDNLLSFMDEHPDFKGQLQFSGQTFGSLMQAAPGVVEHARAIHARGQLNFTGTFYSEPVNVNMDGETNYRCAWLGTKIIEDNIGQTDGFYLQERAYHPQLPWILKSANVSWTPVITNDESYFPFRLRGLDGTLSVCVPITRDDFIPHVEKAPKNALIAIEEDYEIPQTFSRAYARSQEFNASHKDVQIEWITVKEYIRKFGVGEEKFIDHSAKADSPDRGTYSRWTADPLDMVVQDHTNRAMNDFRLANAADAIARHCMGFKADMPFDGSGITLDHDPLVWNIERAELYPDHDKYLARDGKTTLLSKSEQLLLWAVNSDAKGWFPLYEKRRERMNSLDNSSNLSRFVLNRALDALGSQMRDAGYDAHYLVFNLEAARKAIFSIDTDSPCDLYDVRTGKALNSHCVSSGSRCTVSAEASLPAYGYTVVGARKCKSKAEQWTPGNSISNAGMSLMAKGDTLILHTPAKDYAIFMDSFLLKALAHMDAGPGDAEWRDNVKYGPVRTAVSTDGLYPRLRMEWQPDWLVHVQNVLTLKDDCVCSEMTFDFPHPTVVRHAGMPKTRTNFRPEGLDLIIRTGEPCGLGYDIPFGISELNRPGTSYFCPLTSCFLSYRDGGGLMVSPQTGEQAFSLEADKGELTLYLGASTTSGPIREVGLAMPDKTTAVHDFEWYAEPFHGRYAHNITFYPYSGTWQEAHLPKIMRSIQQEPYVREIHPSGGGVPYEMSVITGVPDNVDVSRVYLEDGKLLVRFNEREGRATEVNCKVVDSRHSGTLHPFGIMSF